MLQTQAMEVKGNQEKGWADFVINLDEVDF